MIVNAAVALGLAPLHRLHRRRARHHRRRLGDALPALARHPRRWATPPPPTPGCAAPSRASPLACLLMGVVAPRRRALARPAARRPTGLRYAALAAPRAPRHRHLRRSPPSPPARSAPADIRAALRRPPGLGRRNVTSSDHASNPCRRLACFQTSPRIHALAAASAARQPASTRSPPARTDRASSANLRARAPPLPPSVASRVRRRQPARRQRSDQRAPGRGPPTCPPSAADRR